MKKQFKNKSKLARFINFFHINYKQQFVRMGTCQPNQCETLTGDKGSACCKLGYGCWALKNNNNCVIYPIRPTNCRIFPMIPEDLKLVKNCSYWFEEKNKK